VTLSNNASEGFIKLMGDAGKGVIVTQVFPYERSYAYPFIQEALQIAKESGVNELSPAILEGFAGAKVLVEALKRAGPHPTRAKVLAALEHMNKFDLGGLEVSYSPTDHTGLQFADLSIIGADGRFRR
jgi:ABC-type branched-subunit amino acid transport system substrate-binding protein